MSGKDQRLEDFKRLKNVHDSVNYGLVFLPKAIADCASLEDLTTAYLLDVSRINAQLIVVKEVFDDIVKDKNEN
jgi:hypothetical protein